MSSILYWIALRLCTASSSATKCGGRSARCLPSRSTPMPRAHATVSQYSTPICRSHRAARSRWVCGITHPAVQLAVLLIGERPEEVTHLRRVVDATSVVDASFDEPAARYPSAVELAAQRAMRVVEGGGDAVVLVDSLTRLAGAYNLATTGRAAG